MNDVEDWMRESAPWIVSCIFLGIIGSAIWDFLIKQYKKRSLTKGGRIFLIVVYSIYSVMEFMLFVKSLEIYPYSDFGFWLSIFTPSVVFYALICIFVGGIWSATKKGFFTMRSLRIYKKYHFIFPLLESCFAAANSSYVGLVMSAFKMFFLLINYVRFPEPKKKKAPKKKSG